MTTSSDTCHSEGCRIELPAGFSEKGLCLDHYLQAATYKLDVAASRFCSREAIDSETLDWLLVQVDFVMEAIGDETSSLNAEQRTRLLELLLGIANLNEYIRRNAFTLEVSH